jgi:hypothetical protein
MRIGWVAPFPNLQDLLLDNLPAMGSLGPSLDLSGISAQRAILIIDNFGSLTSNLMSVFPPATNFSCQNGSLYIQLKQKSATGVAASMAGATLSVGAALSALPVFAARRQLNSNRTAAMIAEGGDDDDYVAPRPGFFKGVAQRISAASPSAMMKDARKGAEGVVAVQVSWQPNGGMQVGTASVQAVCHYLHGLGLP